MAASIRHASSPVPLRPRSLDHSCMKGDRFCFSSSFAASCACKNFYVRYPSNRSAISKLENNPAPNSIASRKEFGGSNHNPKLIIWNQHSKCILVRSELAGTGAPNAAYPLSEFQLVPNIRGICFYAITALTSLFLIMPMILAHPLVLLLDRSRRQFHHFIAKLWATLTLALFCKVEFVGLQNLPAPDTPAVYVSNHQSFLDIYILLTLGRSFKFISKTAIFLFPVVGWAMLMMGVVPLKRMDGKSQLECLKRCMDLVKKGASVFFFPEGTRSRDGKLGFFKKGAFSVAAKTRVPVVPITLLGTGKVMPAGMEGTLKAGPLKVVIHQPIKGIDAGVLCNGARGVIAESLHQV